MTDSEPRRVVITGMSVISPLGTDLGSFWTAVSAGRSGVRRIPFGEPLETAFRIGGQVTEFSGHIDDFGELDKNLKRSIRKALKLMCREIQMGVAAAQKALAQARLSAGSFDPDTFGVVFGCDHIVTTPEEFTAGIRACTDASGDFAYERWASDGLPKVSPLWLLKYLPNMPASHIAILNQLRGPNNSLTYREASGTLAVDEAFRTIQRGMATRMLAGATGCNISPIKSFFVEAQSQLADMNGDPASACRPFDKHRTGMVAGEGAAALVLEDRTTAVARDATIYAEILGAGSAMSVDKNGSARLDNSIRNTINATLRSAQRQPNQVGHINAHGLATTQSDIDESQAIRRTFDDLGKEIPVVAVKSYFGNLGAASGLIELIASMLAVRESQLIPTINYQTPDPDCPIRVVDQPEGVTNGTVLAVSATPQGQSSALLVDATPPD